MQEEFSDVKTALEDAYGEHPLLMRMATKTHELFEDHGMAAGQPRQTNFNCPKITYKSVLPEKRDNALYVKKEKLIVYIGNALELQMAPNPKSGQYLDLRLKQLAGGDAVRRGKIQDKGLNDLQGKGRFDELGLEAFIRTCMVGKAPAL